MKTLFIAFTAIILFHTVSYSQWVEQVSGVATDLTSVSAIDADNAWACGYSAVVLRTTNGGSNWTNVTGSPIPSTLNLHNIFGIDANNALVCGSDASGTYVFKTMNAGNTWIQVFTQANGFMNTILMGNPMIGFMYGDPVGGRWSLWGTINGGITWDSTDFYIPQTGTEAGWNNAMFFDQYGGTVWFGTSNTRIYRTFNLLNWTAQPTIGQGNSYAVWFNNSFTGMTGGSGILMTTNGGNDWVAPGMPLPGTANVSGITGISNNWWVTRQSTAIYYSPDNGNSWLTDYSAPNGAYRHIAKSRNSANIVLWAVRTLGGISKNDVPVGIAPASNKIPSSFKLMQNYPNPFNPITNIRFDLPGSGFVKLAVYDEMGKEVAVLVNSELKAGSYSTEFDGSKLSSGVYFYRIYSGNFSETKKMILSK